MKSIVHFNPISKAQQHISFNLEFSYPIDFISISSTNDIKSAVDKIWQYSMEGKWCVGFISYEAAPAFDSSYVVSKNISNIPILQFAIYDDYKQLDFTASNKFNSSSILNLLDLKLDENKYKECFNHIIKSIESGDVYQINYTQKLVQKLNNKFSEHEWLSYYYKLLVKQVNSYSAYLNWFDEYNNSTHNFLSFSPELFFHWEPKSGKIITQPMKGTAKRNHNSIEEDLQIMHKLKSTPKEQAENIMIVDLIRNDLSKIAKLGSVKVENIFECIKLQSVWQMVSTVNAITKTNTSLYDILCALFPCGSITGAPKIEAMKTINLLEQQARGIYCGIVGLIKPYGESIFNVSIRGLHAMHKNELIETDISYGVGSGVTIDAICEDEIKELYAKFSFLNN